MPSRWLTPSCITRASLMTALALPLGSIDATVEGRGPVATPGEAFGVYIALVEDAGVPFEEAKAALEAAFDGAGLTRVSHHDAGCSCGSPARVYTLVDEPYTEGLLAHGTLSAFAVPVRVAVYEDERGVHVTSVDPRSINRTIVSEDEVDELSAAMVDRLRTLAESAFPGRAGVRSYGQMRDEGLIGKTMGIIAGGPFEGKIVEIARVDIDDPSEVVEIAERIGTGMRDAGSGWKWELEPVYSIDLSRHGVAMLGVTGTRRESDAFDIVGTGGDETREDLSCPGVDHAAAFPLKLVVVADGDEARVLIVESMFRMKMYFDEIIPGAHGLLPGFAPPRPARHPLGPAGHHPPSMAHSPLRTLAATPTARRLAPSIAAAYRASVALGAVAVPIPAVESVFTRDRPVGMGA